MNKRKHKRRDEGEPDCGARSRTVGVPRSLLVVSFGLSSNVGFWAPRCGSVTGALGRQGNAHLGAAVIDNIAVAVAVTEHDIPRSALHGASHSLRVEEVLGDRLRVISHVLFWLGAHENGKVDRWVLRMDGRAGQGRVCAVQVLLLLTLATFPTKADMSVSGPAP